MRTWGSEVDEGFSSGPWRVGLVACWLRSIDASCNCPPLKSGTRSGAGLLLVLCFGGRLGLCLRGRRMCFHSKTATGQELGSSVLCSPSRGLRHRGR